MSVDDLEELTLVDLSVVIQRARDVDAIMLHEKIAIVRVSSHPANMFTSTARPL